MSACSPSKEKCCSLISEIIDKSKDIIVETEDVLDYDAVELTLLLKSVGFQLSSFDFECPPNEETADIEVEIKCKQTGIHSRLSMKSKKCTCPTRKSVNNNSFWEVQGIAPSTPVARAKGIVQDTSCNLLPEVSKKTTNLAKTMLTVLLQHYQAEVKPSVEKSNTLGVKQLLERLQGKETEKSTDTKIGKTTMALAQKTAVTNLVSPGEKGNLEANTHCSTPLSSINVTPVPSYDNSMVTDPPKITLNSANDNTQESLIENEKPPDDCCSHPNPKNEMLVTTPTESENPFDKAHFDGDRDICLIQAISDARKQLDTALLMLKCNLTRTLSQSSIMTVTPQSATNFKKPPSPRKDRLSFLATHRRLSADAIDVNRRHSTGASLENRKSLTPNKGLKSASSSNAVNDIKKKQLGSVIRSKISKPDTPRPMVAGKKPLEKITAASKIAMRSPSASSLKGSSVGLKTQAAKTARTSSAGALKKL